MKKNKKTMHRIVAAFVLIISSMAFLYAHNDSTATYSQEAYFGFNYGSSKISGEDAPFVSISIGSELSDRVTVGAFAGVQALSDFPSSDLDLNITDIPSAFNFVIGAEMDVRLFRDSWINPMVHLEAGHLSVAHMSEPTNDQDPKPHILGNSFYASVGTGFELNIFRRLSIVGLHGYRYVPNQAIEDIAAQALSGQYNSVAVKVYLD